MVYGSERQKKQHEYSSALRTLSGMMRRPELSYVLTHSEYQSIVDLAEQIERNVRQRYAEYQKSYQSLRPTSLKTVSEQREEEREELRRGTWR